MITRFKSLYGDRIRFEPGLLGLDASGDIVRATVMLLEGKMLLLASEEVLDSVVRMRCWTAFLFGGNNPDPLKPLIAFLYEKFS